MELLPRELRIGNWYTSSGIESQVEHDDYMNWHVNGCWAEPIPLTEEWLLTLGFDGLGIEEPFFELIYNDVIGYRFSIEGQYGYKEIKYVHHLQNLFHSLTGEELTIKETE